MSDQVVAFAPFKPGDLVAPWRVRHGVWEIPATLIVVELCHRRLEASKVT